MIHKFHLAKIAGHNNIIFWGDGSPLREFMYADDAADAAIFLMDNYNSGSIGSIFVNVGTGQEISIFDLARLIAKVVGYGGNITWDVTKPNGMPRKLLDSSRCHTLLGWQHKTDLEGGLERTYQAYLKNSKP